MNYSILLFDLDDTLLDFRANEAAALPALFEKHGHAFTPEIAAVYHRINTALWSAYELGEIPCARCSITAFPAPWKPSATMEMAPPGEADYRALLALGHQKMEGAAEVCQKLSATHRLFIVTNGVVGTQERRLRDAGLYGFFRGCLLLRSHRLPETPSRLFRLCRRPYPGLRASLRAAHRQFPRHGYQGRPGLRHRYLPVLPARKILPGGYPRDVYHP